MHAIESAAEAFHLCYLGFVLEVSLDEELSTPWLLYRRVLGLIFDLGPFARMPLCNRYW